jgi:predicted AAA+ superfamily ATPase
MEYRRRVIDEVLDELFPGLPAIALEGAKGVGKTATASQRSATVFSLDDPLQFEAIQADLDLLEQAMPPVLVDEWQLLPPVWDRVRRAVDSNPDTAQFLLAGSAQVAPGTRIHSGAGRIVRMVMRPLSLSERGLLEPTVSLRELLTGSRPEIGGASPLTVTNYAEEIVRSGFPGIRDRPERQRRIQLNSYVDRIVDRELADNGLKVRRPRALRAWLAAYGAATATDAAYSHILNAATAGEDQKPARQTVDIYREHLQRIFVLDPVPAWTPAFTPLRRLTRTPKHHLLDPALAASLVGVDKEALVRGAGTRVGASTGTWLGALFESLVTQSVRVYAAVDDAEVGHLRSADTSREVDLIVEGRGQQVVGIEVKLSGTVTDQDVRHLNWLGDELGDRLADKVVVTTGPHAYRRPDGVAVVPLALLGP